MTPEVLLAFVYTPIMTYMVVAPSGTTRKIVAALNRRIIRWEPETLDLALVKHDFVQEDIDRIDAELKAEELRQRSPVVHRPRALPSKKMNYAYYVDEWIAKNDYNRNYQKWNVSKYGR